MRRFDESFGRPKKDKAGEATTRGSVEPQSRSATTRTESIAPEAASSTKTTEAASQEQNLELYSTEGSNGIKVVAEPTDANLEFVQ